MIVSPETDGEVRQSDLHVEPMFGTNYRCESFSEELLTRWKELARPCLHKESGLHLPPPNPYVPTAFDLKPLPPEDAHHPLLHSSLKLGVSVGKKKVEIVSVGFANSLYAQKPHAFWFSHGFQQLSQNSTAFETKYSFPMKMKMLNGTKWTNLFRSFLTYKPDSKGL